MTGADFLDLAVKLVLAQADNPAALRTAISRAYYGAFHLSGDLLRNCGVDFDAGKHNRHHYLGGSTYEPAMEAGRHLLMLRGWRNRADYDLARSHAETLPIAKLCVEAAVQIQTLLALCNQPDARSQIKTGIEQYLRKVGGL